MLRAACIAVLLALPARAQTIADTAAAASADLQAAITALDQAATSKDRVAALTTTIRAYEAGLAALREALRQARLRETQLTLRFEAERGRLTQLLGVLSQIDADPGPLLLLHPSGPVGTARSGMILAEIAPALQAEAERLRAELTELRDLQALQTASTATLAEGLGRAQVARTALSQAISDRTDLPRRFDDDPAAMQALLDSAGTLDAFAAGLAPDAGGTADFAARRGRLPLPVQGTLLRRAEEADAAGVRRPGLTLATRPQALVTAPHAGTIRYRGPLLDYGNVMILEPGGDYLLVLAGLETVYGEVGEVVAEGAALGLMGGAEAPDARAEFMALPDAGGAVRETETLYMELRRGTVPEDPAPWFAALGE
ncbi:MAG: murein hydrolase activator EnvC family protein [Gemmobacter sp.]